MYHTLLLLQSIGLRSRDLRFISSINKYFLSFCTTYSIRLKLKTLCIYLPYFGFVFILWCKVIWIALLYCVHYCCVTCCEAELLDIARYIFGFVVFVCNLLRILPTVLQLSRVNLVSFGYLVRVLLKYYYFDHWCFKFEFATSRS